MLKHLQVGKDYNLTSPQKDAILFGLKELDNGLGRKNEDVLKEFRNKYPNA